MSRCAQYDLAGDAITWGDTVHGSLWGETQPITTGGVYTFRRQTGDPVNDGSLCRHRAGVRCREMDRFHFESEWDTSGQPSVCPTSPESTDLGAR